MPAEIKELEEISVITSDKIASVKTSQKQTRKRKTDEYGHLCENFYKNLSVLLQEEGLSQRKLAHVLGFNVTAVNKWALGKTLPPTDFLYLLAGHFHVTIDWLLSPHEDQETENAPATYSELFRTLSLLIRNNLIPGYNGEDPFLIRLLDQAEHIEKMANISSDQKRLWFFQVEKDYALPLLPVDFCRLFFPTAMQQLSEIDEYKAYLNCLKALQGWYLISSLKSLERLEPEPRFAKTAPLAKREFLEWLKRRDF